MAVDFEDAAPRVVVNSRDINKVIIQEANNEVKISASGPQGIPGPAGPQGEVGPTGLTGQEGPQGVPGETQLVSYTHIQNEVSYTWGITHNLGYFPNITTTDASGFTIEGSVEYTSTNTATITFSLPTTGFAYIS